MLKIKVFTAKNVQRYGLTDGEIEELNAEWERKASGLGLDQHLPEYWQEAKRHMSEKLEGRVAVSIEQSGNKQLDGEPIDLPSLDVNLDDFDIADENEITAAALSEGETLVEVVPEELPELESISVDELELEVVPAGQVIAAAERAEDKEPAAVVATGELTSEQAEAAQKLTIPPAERAEAQAAEERIVPSAEPELQAEDTARQPEIAAEEPVREAAAEEGSAPVAGAGFMSAPQDRGGKEEEQQKESFFGKIISSLQKLFKL